MLQKDKNEIIRVLRWEADSLLRAREFCLEGGNKNPEHTEGLEEKIRWYHRLAIELGEKNAHAVALGKYVAQIEPAHT